KCKCATLSACLNYPNPVIYQLKLTLRGISPLIWRRLFVRAETSVAELHHILQLTTGWTNSHLHRFLSHGKEYGVAHEGAWALPRTHTKSGWRILVSVSASGFCMSMTLTTTGSTIFGSNRAWQQKPVGYGILRGCCRSGRTR